MSPNIRKMTRMAKRALADMRALEEEAERFNPVGAGKHSLIDHLEHPTKAYGRKKAMKEESESDENAPRRGHHTPRKVHFDTDEEGHHEYPRYNRSRSKN